MFKYIVLLFALVSSGRCRVISEEEIESTTFNSTSFDESVDDIYYGDNEIARQGFNLIFPATKWCGNGNVASSYDDLGWAKKADMCCRDHDHCPDIIPAGETKYNLINTALYSRLSCECDEAFRQCLRNVDGIIGNKVGQVYFNGLATKCFKLEYPVVRCRAYGGWFKRKCVDYEFDTTGEKRYQWFHVRNY